VLTVDALGLYHSGHTLHRSAAGVWLVEVVPVRYLTVPDAEADRGDRALER
jgi:RNA:NAD 2'-phosphotransferase (TPT1/KptA family)